MEPLKITILSAFLVLTACSNSSEVMSPGGELFDALSAQCGKAFKGQLVSNDAVDADFGVSEIVMHIRECSATEIRIPLHVGENRSRTWVISKIGDGLRLKHDHRHEDGSEDAVTQYGGDTLTEGTVLRQEFPADVFSKEMFVREGLAVSVDNIWAIEVGANNKFAYELLRPNRFFRLEFNLEDPVEEPPAPWGSN